MVNSIEKKELETLKETINVFGSIYYKMTENNCERCAQAIKPIILVDPKLQDAIDAYLKRSGQDCSEDIKRATGTQISASDNVKAYFKAWDDQKLPFMQYQRAHYLVVRDIYNVVLNRVHSRIKELEAC